MLPLSPSPGYFKEINSIISKFIWNDKCPRIKLTTLQRTNRAGGLAVPNFELYYWSFQLKALFFYQHFFLFVFSHITQHNIQNIIKQQTHTQHLKVQSKGRERGKDNKNTKVTPLYNHVYPSKNTAKHQWLRA